MSLPGSAPLPEPLPPPPELPIWHLGNLEEEINLPTTLRYERQCVLLVKLRRSLRDPTTAQEAGVLLERLRNRPDLFAESAEEIEEMLEGKPSTVSPFPDREKKPVIAARQEPETPARRESDSKPWTPPSQGQDVGLSETRHDLSPEVEAGGQSKGVFLDPDTLLMWTMKDNGRHVDWNEANDLASQHREGGYSDWRLPTVEELESLYDPTDSGEFRSNPPLALVIVSFGVPATRAQGPLGSLTSATVAASQPILTIHTCAYCVFAAELS